jgi:hypothetical protein
MNDRTAPFWVAGCAVLVFGIGLAAGVLLDRSLGPRPAPPDDVRAGFTRGPMGPPGGRLVERLAEELELTGDQRQKLEGLLEERRKRLDGVRIDMGARFAKEQEELRSEIRRLLTDDQAARFDELMRRGPGFLGPPGPPPEPGGFRPPR